MWYERSWQWAKEHLTITVPGVVSIFAATYVVMLAVNAGEVGAAWVQAVGSVVAILAAWIIPHRHELAKEQRQKNAIITGIGALSTRQAILFRKLEHLMSCPPDHHECDWDSFENEWSVHKAVVEAFAPEAAMGFDVSFLIYLRQGANFGVMAAAQVRKWDLLHHDDPDRELIKKVTWHKEQIANFSLVALKTVL
ncbi:hypothetical protein ACIGKM_11630 [Ectopseudomonas toyotomiensis]|uniref:hypothetical protein n=1 Tax=Ectopseudomonas toyotomiensis TaxID=554344 RepID=UPI0037C559B0